eukprot:3906517-Ditylum_brightwellii.AAC.2
MNTKTATNHLPSSSISLYELNKRNQDNQEKLPRGPFKSSKQLQVFRHDFKGAMHRQVHWKQILQINTAEGIKDILTNFMLIDEQDLKWARLKCSPEEATAAKNICMLTTTRLMVQLFCTGTTESVIRTYQLNLNNLPEKLEELRFDVNKFCDYAAETLKTLCDAGGDDTQASLKLYEALMSSKVDAFNSEIRAYKATVSAKDIPLDFTKFTTIAHA